MHWTLASLPELGHLSRRDARTVIRRCIPVSARIRLWIRPAFLSICLALPAALLAVAAGAEDLAPFVCITVIVTGWLAIHLLQVRRVQADLRGELRTLLAGSRAPACLVCGFDLRGSASASCPECGAATVFPERAVTLRFRRRRRW